MWNAQHSVEQRNQEDAAAEAEQRAEYASRAGGREHDEEGRQLGHARGW